MLGLEDGTKINDICSLSSENSHPSGRDTRAKAPAQYNGARTSVSLRAAEGHATQSGRSIGVW